MYSILKSIIMSQKEPNDALYTWEPGTTGVDERYWKEITKEEAEALLKAE